jgi:hypothetical protein
MLPTERPDPQTPARSPAIRLSGWQKIRAHLKGLTARSRFWHELLTFFFMPSLWRSGLRMRLTPDHFEAVLPYNRNNRNFDGNMAGAALLGSCEVAAGGYVFQAAAGQVEVVCKRLAYSFRHPCRGPAEYRVRLHDGLAERIAAREPFTLDLDVEVFEREGGAARRRIGSAAVTFHARPLGYVRARDRQRLVG